MRKYTTQSGNIPLEIDDTSSKTYTYVHSNIVEIENEQEDSDEVIISYSYDVTEYTKLEYEILLNMSNSDSERISALEENNQLLKQELLDTQLALAEIFEAQLQ